MNLSGLVTAHEAAFRLAVFGGVFAAMIAWEFVAPRRGLMLSRWQRWPGNIAIVALNTVVLRLSLPVAAAGLAMTAEAHGWGLFNQVTWHPLLELVAAVVVLDLVVYLQHVMFHAVPAFWRLHRMHHADLDFDVTTGSRFHPIEIVMSMLLKMAVVLVLGPSAAAVIVFEMLLNGTSLFNHGNVRIPAAVDRALRLVIVTPDMHRVHHSSTPRETNSNFGFNLSIWDRLLGTYRAQPERGHEGMEVGLHEFREPGASRLDRLLIQPFVAGDSEYSINRRG